MTAGHHVADLGRHRQDSCYIPETRRKPDVPLATNIGFESRLLRQRVVANPALASISVGAAASTSSCPLGHAAPDDGRPSGLCC